MSQIVDRKLIWNEGGVFVIGLGMTRWDSRTTAVSRRGRLT
jgi:hypothetical protein